MFTAIKNMKASAIYAKPRRFRQERWTASQAVRHEARFANDLEGKTTRVMAMAISD